MPAQRLARTAWKPTCRPLDPKTWLTMPTWGGHLGMADTSRCRASRDDGMDMKDMSGTKIPRRLRVMHPSARSMIRPRSNAVARLTYAESSHHRWLERPRGACARFNRLTGNMQPLHWGSTGRSLPKPPLHFDHGERLRIVLSNDRLWPPDSSAWHVRELEEANGE